MTDPGSSYHGEGMRDEIFGAGPGVWCEDALFSSLRTVDEVMRDADAPGGSVTRQALISICNYVLEFLRAGHPDLGRTGPVCPFAAGATKKGMLQITLCDRDEIDERDLVQGIDTFRSYFPEFDDPVGHEEEMYRAVIVVFSHLPARAGAELIERVQKQLKPMFVSQGLMIGEFYPDCPASGVHNPDFRALQAPVISLAIRRMTVFDAPFMLGDPRCLENYLQRFGQAAHSRVEALGHTSSARINAANPASA